jgi:hypothetical protein
VAVTAAEKMNSGGVGEAKLKLKSSRVKDGEFRKVERKLWEGLSWIEKGCGGLPTMDRKFAREELERRRWIQSSGWNGIAKECEMEGGEASARLRLAKKTGGGMHGCWPRWRRGGGRAELGHRPSGVARWRKARGEELERQLAWKRRVGATGVENGASIAAVMVSGSSLQRERGGSSGGQQSDVDCSGKASREGLRRRASSGATRGD